jgi:hypothetical protein
MRTSKTTQHDDFMFASSLRVVLRKWGMTGKLPPVLPLVLFQGGAQWTADLSLSGLIDIPDGLASYQLEYRHLLVDLSHIKTEELQGTLFVRTILPALKASREGLHRELPRLFQFLAETMVRQDVGPAMIRTLLRYICVVDNDTDLTETPRVRPQGIMLKMTICSDPFAPTISTFRPKELL